MPKSAREAWRELTDLRSRFYRKHAAEYGGDRQKLNATGEPGSFWVRRGKCKIHVPIAADIAATAADLLFGEEPRMTCFHQPGDDAELPTQKRLDELINRNHIYSLLSEAAESAAAMGNVYLKLSWRDNIRYPVLTITQADNAVPEYTLGVLDCIHFFSVLRHDSSKDEYIRVYECYEPGRITMAVYKGNGDELGTDLGDKALESLGYARTINAPVKDMLAVHIPNMRPNRIDRDSMLGRSDIAGLRGLCDSLDETFSSWMRDIRLAKARLIVPAEFMRKRPNFDEADGSGKYVYEFDEDVETYVAMDMDPDHPGNAITPSQFAIRSQEHAQTCAELIRQIVSLAGYAPQTFGMDINGSAQSGTALHIREKKSYNTLGKKQNYWKSTLESILTALVHLDAALFPEEASDAYDTVTVSFADNTANDLTAMSAAVEMINRAEAASTATKVQMLHPDWNQKQLDEEVQRIRLEQGTAVDDPAMGLGDYEQPGEL